MHSAKRTVEATSRAPRNPPPERRTEELTYRCQSCRASYESSGAWRALPILAEVPAHEVRSMVEDWPSELVVRVRRCPCGQRMARKERVT